MGLSFTSKEGLCQPSQSPPHGSRCPRGVAGSSSLTTHTHPSCSVLSQAQKETQTGDLLQKRLHSPLLTSQSSPRLMQLN